MEKEDLEIKITLLENDLKTFKSFYHLSVAAWQEQAKCFVPYVSPKNDGVFYGDLFVPFDHLQNWQNNNVNAEGEQNEKKIDNLSEQNASQKLGENLNVIWNSNDSSCNTDANKKARHSSELN